MNILCVGDVIGSVGTAFLRKNIRRIKQEHAVDICIVNGENSADTNGITPDSASALLDCGADMITTGNHSYQRRESYDLYEDSTVPVLRPANFPDLCPGRGYDIIDKGRYRVAVVNLMGLVGMFESLACPFETADRLLESIDTKYIVVDFHAEATAEKRALAEYLDGRVSCLFGTHTHVQTADEQILTGGTGFITDVGMTGPIHSVIGARIDAAVSHMRSHMPTRLEYADGDCMINAVLFTLDEKTGKTTKVERIDVR